MHNTHLCPHTQILIQNKNTYEHMCKYAQILWANIYDPFMHNHTSTHLHTHAQRLPDSLHRDPRPRKESVCSMSRSMLELVRKFFAAPAELTGNWPLAPGPPGSGLARQGGSIFSNPSWVGRQAVDTEVTGVRAGVALAFLLLAGM